MEPIRDGQTPLDAIANVQQLSVANRKVKVPRRFRPEGLLRFDPIRTSKLNQAVDENDPRIVSIRVNPEFKSIRSDSRYPMLLERIGF